ncbi:ATP-binding cassette domain-containing protein [Roseobacter weihaiensis]|uniref:ATP-binding cassette domain-containing protein n=1 Tax=Roseobacter weihaiensis TaxID=2763262 RepID=UPI0029CAAE15|nr:ATP-binding cassette domain-containing protein [Roseobacter sp. H9]
MIQRVQTDVTQINNVWRAIITGAEASGAGKSIIFNPLTGLIDPAKGPVRIGGVATNEMALQDLRSLCSVVTQEALLFDGTLREQTLTGRTDVTKAELTAAPDAANVSDFLDKLPEGLDTKVGPRGSGLSGGQRQRAVIARALFAQHADPANE